MAGLLRSCPLIGAIDQGTSSSRFFIFAADTGEVLTSHQVEVDLIFPQDGWVEQDPMHILRTVEEAMDRALDNLEDMNISCKDIQGLGVTNQRETTVVWDKETGQPLYNAISWLDTRTAATVESLLLKTPSGHDKDYLRSLCGLPLSTYFSAVKLRWLLDNSVEVRAAIDAKRALFGTIDSWLIWNLTGGPKVGMHVTDVTNASRTMLLNINTLQWDERLIEFFYIPAQMLPAVRSSSEIYGIAAKGKLHGVPICGILGDQQAALIGQGCFQRGQTKITYGTGSAMLCNIGSDPIISKHGLITTVAYQMGPNKAPVYALEGSIAVAGACISWLANHLGLKANEAETRENRSWLRAKEAETLAFSVPDPNGVYFVPAFSGLFCPYWQHSARGTICGLTHFSTAAHVCRAAFEAICFQTKEVLDAMLADCDISLECLLVDGGMCSSAQLLQLQADILGLPVVKPAMHEATVLGVAYAAGKALNIWRARMEDETVTHQMIQYARPNNSNRNQYQVTIRTYFPNMPQEERDYKMSKWKEAVQKSMFRMNPGESPISPSATDHIKKKSSANHQEANSSHDERLSWSLMASNTLRLILASLFRELVTL